jgi:1-acyl-sn-glycerol-3-phosphate acyltransferase
MNTVHINEDHKKAPSGVAANIFARIWALWALVIFIITFLIFFLPSMIAYFINDPKKGQAYFVKVSRWWMNIWLPLAGCPLTVKGRENFQPGNAYVVVFNHNFLYLDCFIKKAPYWLTEKANKAAEKVLKK